MRDVQLHSTDDELHPPGDIYATNFVSEAASTNGFPSPPGGAPPPPVWKLNMLVVLRANAVADRSRAHPIGK